MAWGNELVQLLAVACPPMRTEVEKRQADKSDKEEKGIEIGEIESRGGRPDSVKERRSSGGCNRERRKSCSMASLPSGTTTFTHLLALLAGVVIGKSIDADELDAYRSSNDESIFASLRRRLKSTIVVGLVLGLVVKVGTRAIMCDGSKEAESSTRTK